MRGSLPQFIAVVSLAGVLALPLYLLSIYPVMQLGYDEKLSWEAIDIIYAPVFWTCDRIPLAREWLYAGEEWWRYQGQRPVDPPMPNFSK